MGGHAERILEGGPAETRLFGVDRDPEAIRRAGLRLARFGERVVLRHGSFRDIVQLAADACEVPVMVGPSEISVLGNACVQLVALGVLGSLREARAMIRRSFAPREVAPRQRVPEIAVARFQALASHRETTS